MLVIPAKAGIHFRFCLWLFTRTSSLPSVEDTDAAIYIRLIRSGFGRGAPSRESESNAKTKAKIIKWIPAFAGMTVVFRIEGLFHQPQNGRARWSAPTENESFKLENSPFPVGKQPSRAEFILPPSHQGESHSARRLLSLSPSSVENDPQPGTTRHFPAFPVKTYLVKYAKIPARKASVLIAAGRKKMERAIRIRPPLPVLNSARAQTPRLVREFLKNTINSDKFTGFFDKKEKNYFIDFQRVMGFRGRFSANFDTKNFRCYVKFRRGISPPNALQSRSAGCRSCPRPLVRGWSRGNSARRAAP